MRLRPPIKKLRRESGNALLRVRVGAAPVSFVANNCWGGFVSHRLKRQYASPFVGLFLMPDCYLQLLENFERTLTEPLKFTSQSRYPEANAARLQTPYPLAVLGEDVELHFLHAHSEAEAFEGWTRRLTRLDRKHLAFKLCDRDGCTDEHIERFVRLPFERKVCFVSRPRPSVANTIVIPGFEADGQLPPNLADVMDPYFDLARWLKSGECRAPSIAMAGMGRVLTPKG